MNTVVFECDFLIFFYGILSEYLSLRYFIDGYFLGIPYLRLRVFLPLAYCAYSMPKAFGFSQLSPISIHVVVCFIECHHTITNFL